MRRSSAYTAAITGALLAVALVLGYIESLIPFQFGVPGIKLGLPNLLTVIVLEKKGFRAALPFGLLRAIISNLLFGTALSLAYAVAGCVLSVTGMWLAGRIKVFSLTGKSVVGGIAHNLGQLVAAVVLLATPGVFYYAPFLMISGAVTGFLIGFAAALVLRKCERFLEIY